MNNTKDRITSQIKLRLAARLLEQVVALVEECDLGVSDPDPAKSWSYFRTRTDMGWLVERLQTQMKYLRAMAENPQTEPMEIEEDVFVTVIQ